MHVVIGRAAAYHSNGAKNLMSSTIVSQSAPRAEVLPMSSDATVDEGLYR